MAIGQGWAEGSFTDAGWVVGAWVQASVTKTIGASSALEAFTSSATLNVVVPKTVGASSQLEAFTSSGGIQGQDPVEEDAPSGGFWVRYEQERYRREDERKRRARLKREAKKIKEKLDRELYLAERKLEEDAARKAELARINRLVSDYKETIIQLDSPKLTIAMDEALKRQTFSTMERLERELAKACEEEEFLLMATQILINDRYLH